MPLDAKLAFSKILAATLEHVYGSALSARHMLAHRRRDVPITRGNTFDFVTVVCSRDLSLLRLQARSVALYLDVGFSGSIILIVNDLQPNRLILQIKDTILPDYGRWRARVIFIPFYHLGFGLDPANGWKIQQALKLAASSLIEKPFYVVLDSKNHFVRRVFMTDFVTTRGFARQKLDADKPTLDIHAQVCARFLGLSPEDIVPCWPMTPFVFHTHTARKLVACIEQQEKRSIFSTFRRVRWLSEFLLYKAYLHIAELEGHPAPYEAGPMLSRTVWPGQCIAAAITDADDDLGILVFGVHRDVLQHLGFAERQSLDLFWRKRGLLEPVAPQTRRGAAAFRARRKTLRAETAAT